MQASFSEEEAAIAQSEGWTKLGNTVRPVAGADGVYRFYSQGELYKFLRHKAKTSEFHFDVYRNLHWNAHDVTVGLHEYGFSLWPTVGSLHDRTGCTSVQEHMETIVQNSETDPVCAKALRIITKYRLTSGDTSSWQQSD